MEKLPGTGITGSAGRTDKAGALQKNTAPGLGGKTGAGDTNRLSPARPPQGAAKTTAPPAAGPHAPKTLSALALSLGLPGDSRSVSILSFARHFSLPLNPVLLARIRRESLPAVPEEPRPGTARSPQGRDAGAAALAAAAAAAKGLQLSREGLAAYAAALSGHWTAEPENQPGEPGHGPGGGGPGNGGSSGGNRGGPGGGGPGNDGGDKPGGGEPGNGKRGGVHPDDLTRADRLREKVLEIEPPLLGLLNRVPGKNGGRWIALPFAFSRKGLEYRAVLRILLNEPPSKDSPGRLALDISGGDRDQPALRWFFMYDKLPGETVRLRAHFWPPETQKSLNSFQKELSRLLSLHPKQIYVQNDEKNALFAADCRESVLPSINEEV